MSQITRGVHADPLVASTARGMAAEMFEEFMRAKGGNQLFARMQAKYPGADATILQEKFVMKMAPRLLGEARATLARMLGDPTKKDLHPAIHTALLRDATLRRGRIRI